MERTWNMGKWNKIETILIPMNRKYEHSQIDVNFLQTMMVTNDSKPGRKVHTLRVTRRSTRDTKGCIQSKSAQLNNIELKCYWNNFCTQSYRQRTQQRLDIDKEIKLSYTKTSPRELPHWYMRVCHTLSTKATVFGLQRSPHGTTALTATAATTGNRDLTTAALSKDKERQRGEERSLNRSTTEQKSRRPKLL